MMSPYNLPRLHQSSLYPWYNNISDSEKTEILTAYAPLIYIGTKSFYPSSVEWTFPHLQRVLRTDNDGKPAYWVVTKQPLSSPTQILPYFNGNPNLDQVPIYAYWIDKPGGITDLTYYTYYPYNLGKRLSIDATFHTPNIGPITTPNIHASFDIGSDPWGNHVGDWEHITVRIRGFNKVGDKWQPDVASVTYSAHNFVNTYAWADVHTTGNTHPIAFAAIGSHGLWKDPGSHRYLGVSVSKGPLEFSAGSSDDTAQTNPWYTWNNVQAFDYNRQVGLNTTWPLWMNTNYNYTVPGKDPSDPASGAIFRWGNPEQRCDIAAIIHNVIPSSINNLIGGLVDISELIGDFVHELWNKSNILRQQPGVCILEDGPTGPPDKGVWRNIVPPQ